MGRSSLPWKNDGTDEKQSEKTVQICTGSGGGFSHLFCYQNKMELYKNTTITYLDTNLGKSNTNHP